MLDPRPTTPEQDRCYGEGSDARIAGYPLVFCPYVEDDEKHLRRKWREGWRDVDREWGADKVRDEEGKVIWEPKPLVPLLQVA